jgi:hypothetical protein
MARPDDLVRLAVASSEVEALILRDALEQEGIRPFIRNSAPLAYLGGDAMFATYAVFVLARDEKRARWIIGESILPCDPEPAFEEQQETAATD